MEEPTLTASALLGLALLQLVRPDASAVEAAPLIAESLALRRAMGEPLPLTSSLIGAAMLALRVGDAAGAARLIGAVDAQLAAVEAPAESEMQGFYTRTRAEARHALGEASFESERASGARWSLDDAVGVALKSASAGVAE
jgi:hypothetical protein